MATKKKKWCSCSDPVRESRTPLEDYEAHIRTYSPKATKAWHMEASSLALKVGGPLHDHLAHYHFKDGGGKASGWSSWRAKNAYGSTARDPAAHRRYTYHLEPLTPREFETLVWLAERGYDGELLAIAGVEGKLSNGDVVLGALSEPEAWEFREYVEKDPHAFLASNGSKGLSSKMWRLHDSIV